MKTKIAALAAVIAVTIIAAGCTGSVRETTTARTSTEMLLVSTAAERAVRHFDVARLADKRVVIDDSQFDSVDKNYVVSSLRHWIAEHGAILLAKDAKDPGPDYVLEIRNGSLGVYDSTWGIGIPALPLPVPQTSLTTVSPPLHLVFRAKQEGWAKFQIWLRHPSFNTYVARSGDLWGHSYQSVWWFFGFGPFTCSEDIYPEDEVVEVDEEEEARLNAAGSAPSGN